MELKETFKRRLEEGIRSGWEIKKEEKTKIELFSPTLNMMKTFQYIKKFNDYMRKIPDIAVKKCHVEKMEYDGEKDVTYICEFRLGNHELQYECCIFKNMKMMQTIQIKEGHFQWLNKTNKEKFFITKEEIRVMKHVLLEVRNYIKGSSEYRLKQLFQPFSYTYDSDWLLHS